MSKKKKAASNIPTLPPGFRREESNSLNTATNMATFSSMLSPSSTLSSAENNSPSSAFTSFTSSAIVTAKASIRSPVPANKEKLYPNFPSRVLQQTLVLERNLTNFERASLSKLSIIAMNPTQMSRMGLSTSELVLVSYTPSIPFADDDNTTLHGNTASSLQKTLYWLCEAWPLQTIPLNSARTMLHPLGGFNMSPSVINDCPQSKEERNLFRNDWVTLDDSILTSVSTSPLFSSSFPVSQLSLHTPPPDSSVAISVLPRLPISVNSIVFMRVSNPVHTSLDSLDSFGTSESFESLSLSEHSIANALNSSLQQTLIAHLTSMPFLLGSTIHVNVTNSLISTSGLAGSVSGKIATFVPLAVHPSSSSYSSQFHALQPFIGSSTTAISFVASPEQLITHISGSVANETATSSDLAVESSLKSKVNAFSSIGGLERELSLIREAVELPLLQPELFSVYGVKPPRGVLLYGPPGTGKTMIARALASQATASFFSLSGAEITGRLLGEAEARVRSIFATAAEQAPSVVFIDEIDALCPHRDGADETQKRVVAALLSILDGVHAMRGVVLLAATNRPNALDPALRRPGRLDREVEIGVPSREGRMDILTKALQSVRHVLSEDDVRSVAEKAHGYVGADLQLVVREAALHCMHRLFSRDFSSQSHQELDDDDLNDNSTEVLSPLQGLCLTVEDLKEGLASVKPSALRSVALDVPNVRWDDVGGQWEVKERLKEAFEWPLEDPEVCNSIIQGLFRISHFTFILIRNIGFKQVLLTLSYFYNVFPITLIYPSDFFSLGCTFSQGRAFVWAPWV